VLISGVAAWVAILPETDKEESVTNRGESTVAADITTQDLITASRARVFFGHQSVGMNILDGTRAVYAAHGMAAPKIEQEATTPSSEGGFINHAFIGENGNPLLKIQDFDKKLHSGLAGSVDVAMMKLCYVDITSDTNVDEVLAAYSSTMADLQRDYPDVTFVYATVPLTTDPGLLQTVKRWVKRSSQSEQADNVARERLNGMIRRSYSGSHLFDLAAAESTAPDGSRTVGTDDGQQYYRLYDGHAADNGHLNGAGAEVVATAWLRAVAQAATR
jgi:hypothetical protein